MPRCLITLDDYKAELLRLQNRDKAVIEKCERYLADFRRERACCSCSNQGWISRFEFLLAMLRG